MEMESLKGFIGTQGWSDFGIIEFDGLQKALNKHEVVFEEWSKKGFIADMNYLDHMKNDRFHPANKLKSIKSAIILTAWYGHEIDHKSLSKKGVVARYASGKDYHKQLKKKLIDLSNWLKVSSGRGEVETYVSVDSGPTVDRVLAQEAGLGFFGKNACIINPSKGSYFFIATIFSNIVLSSTAKRPMPNCGSCNKCSISCPTGALKGPGELDARLCISYLTIENKGGIPLELRSKIGNRIFGCDICQEVCPFNIGRARRQEILIENLKGQYGVGDSLDLKEVLSIQSDEDYIKKFAGTPLMRAKRRGLIRNACVVAGNIGDKSLIPYLQNLIESEDDAMLKEHAQWAIEQITV